MLCLSGFELYSRWVPLSPTQIIKKLHFSSSLLRFRGPPNVNSQFCLNAFPAVGRSLLVQSIFGAAEFNSMSSLSSDEEFRESLLSFSAVLTLYFGGI